ncbi:MAG: hypothetical protein IKZ49_04100 [Alphaproteobacteria bacterium]|nr:hypothetical protein [Alphaproteobacteria bacterium]
MAQIINDIIKYNTSRQYFGRWTPEQLHRAYNEARNSEISRTSTLHTGVISVDDICDTLWNEMSYNPARFGTKSPFIFDGKNSITKFCDKYKIYIENKKPNLTIDEKLAEETKIFLVRLSYELQKFLTLIDDYDPSFKTTGITSTDYIMVGLQDDSENSNIGYKLLAKLVYCIHEICKQNLSDLSHKSLGLHKDIIKTIVEQRHKDLVRPVKIPNYRKIKSLKEEQKILDDKISSKQNEISETEMRLNSYEDYFEEAPVDVSSEKHLLIRQNQELGLLEDEYQNIQNLLNFLLGKTNGK